MLDGGGLRCLRWLQHGSPVCRADLNLRFCCILLGGIMQAIAMTGMVALLSILGLLMAIIGVHFAPGHPMSYVAILALVNALAWGCITAAVAFWLIIHRRSE